jgi:hypothetical protein
MELFKAVAKYFPTNALLSMPVGCGEGNTWLEALVACFEDIVYQDTENDLSDLDKDCEIIINFGNKVARIPVTWLRS